MNEAFEQLYKLSPPVSMALAINFVMLGVRRIPNFPTWTAPFIAMAIGGIFYPLLADPGNVLFAVRSPLAAQFITGVSAGGLAVAFHQQFKQILKRFGVSTGDTEMFTKDQNEKFEPSQSSRNDRPGNLPV